MGRVNMEKGRVQAGTGIPVFSNVRFGYVGYDYIPMMDIEKSQIWAVSLSSGIPGPGPITRVQSK